MAKQMTELRERLDESEQTLEAIRHGDIDAVVVTDRTGEHRVYTLETADRPYRELIEQMQEGAVTLSDDGTVLYCNRRLAGMLGVLQARVIGQNLGRFLPPADVATFARLLSDARHGGGRSELTLMTAEGRRVPTYVSLSRLHDNDTILLCGVLTDLTEQQLHLRELAEANTRLKEEIAERERVEEVLRQSQKMEAVGQLTGGLAHDFNNLLTGITGSLEMLQTRVAQGRFGELARYIGAAQGAAARAASLTHRLLAFSRRQALAPVPNNPNRLITGMEDLIRRTVGPPISFQTTLSTDLWPTLCDPNQLENALLNLAINSRDAMPDGGALTIETSNVWLDARGARERDMAPGQYIVISVIDTGVGMEADVIARAFDPFFTTKPIGMGTGLGLSMIYGFTRQSGGHVHIESRPAHGTTVRLYLPRHGGAAIDEAGSEPIDEPGRAAASETVLVVDDEATVRMLIAEVLAELGYGTIEAEDGPTALKVLNSPTRIDLLITDIGLPSGLNGRQVADAARERRPGTKVLFITGYADAAVIGGHPLDPGMEVMTKPFALGALAGRIRTMLTSA